MSGRQAMLELNLERRARLSVRPRVGACPSGAGRLVGKPQQCGDLQGGEPGYDKERYREEDSERRDAGRIIATRITLDKQVDDEPDNHHCGRRSDNGQHEQSPVQQHGPPCSLDHFPEPFGEGRCIHIATVGARDVRAPEQNYSGAGQRRRVACGCPGSSQAGEQPVVAGERGVQGFRATPPHIADLA
jgi:hypothetical protein